MRFTYVLVDALRHHVVTVLPRPRHSRKSNIWTLGRMDALRVCEKVEKTESTPTVHFFASQECC